MTEQLNLALPRRHAGGRDGTGVQRPILDCFPWLERIHPERALLRGRAYAFAKRAMDLALVLLALPVAMPLLAACALSLKLETPSAPVLFIQQRTGKGGQRFRMVKFRTMVVDAEAKKAALTTMNELRWPDFKIRDDPRVTRVGRLLRATSLDELPQVFNVLRGDMSLVGPRPTSFSAESYDLWHTERLDVAPGITGLWQLAGRGTSDLAERSRMDIAYIERRCLWLDWVILFRTIPAVIGRKGAH